MDIPCAPILADITVNGRADQGGRAADQAGLGLRVRSRDRPAGVADRRAARWRRATCRASGIRRRSRSSPSRRPSSGRASPIDDLIDFTPELRAEAVKRIVANYKIGPIFTPPVVSKWPRPARHADLAGRRPAARTGRAVRSIRKRNILYIFSNSGAQSLGLVPPEAGAIRHD